MTVTAVNEPPPSPATRANADWPLLLVRVVVLLGLASVAAASLSLSARPIMLVARVVGVPDESLWRAVVMVEGAVLVLTLLWLHPATRTGVRWMATIGAVVGLSLSAAAGIETYGPVGCVPGLLYAWVVHTLSREMLGGAQPSTKRTGTARWHKTTQTVRRASTRLRDRREKRARHTVTSGSQPAGHRDPWGGPEAVHALEAVPDTDTVAELNLYVPGATRTKKQAYALAKELDVKRRATESLGGLNARLDEALAARDHEAVTA